MTTSLFDFFALPGHISYIQKACTLEIISVLETNSISLTFRNLYSNNQKKHKIKKSFRIFQIPMSSRVLPFLCIIQFYSAAKENPSHYFKARNILKHKLWIYLGEVTVYQVNEKLPYLNYILLVTICQ